MRYNGNTMSKRQVIMILAALVAVIQFLGFPTSWNKFFAFVCGILIIGIAYRMAPRVKTVNTGSLPYDEHKRVEIK
jgi:hypothetical protein